MTVTTSTSRRRVVLSMGAGLLLYLALFFAFSQVFQPLGAVVQDLKTCKGQQRKLSGLFHLVLKKRETLQLCGTLTASADDTLVIPRIASHGLRVFVDGKQLLQKGGRQPTANIWYALHIIHLPAANTGTPRKLRIQLNGLFDLGVRALPYTTTWKTSQVRLGWYRFLLQDFLWVIVGACLLLAILLILYSLQPSRVRKAHLMVGLSCLLGIVYLQEFGYRETSGSLAQFFWFRKLCLICGYFALWLALAGFEWAFRWKLRKALWALPFAAVASILVLWQGDFYSLKMATRTTAILIMVSPLLTIWEIFEVRLPALILPVTFYAIAMFHSAWIIATNSNAPYLLHIGVIIGNMGIGMYLLQHYQLVQQELQKTEKKAFLDPLTGAYNRYMLEGLTPSAEDTVVLVDMNNFKHVNDEFGHDKGDELLAEWVLSAKDCLRREDLVFRLGGDEFLLLLQAPVEHRLQAIVERIEENWRGKFEGMPVSFSYGFEQVGNSLEEAIQKADQNMFADKRSYHSLKTVGEKTSPSRRT